MKRTRPMARAVGLSVVLLAIAVGVYGFALGGSYFGLAGGCLDNVKTGPGKEVEEKVAYWPPGKDCSYRAKNGVKEATAEFTWAPPVMLGLGGAAILILAAGAFAATNQRIRERQ